ncbi:MAG TPA: class I mannose-6-phosphate isomerase [Sedimentisphaerales bacterium]|nr:class I mannose-6-phosphate isomerase [Sedimentisphaerales bacterium]
MNAYPLILEPIYKERIWGGQKLKSFFGKDLPHGKKIGESWELADLPNDKSTVANGEFAGRAFSELIKQFPQEMTGDKNFKLPFPLLFKLLDAQDVLSVQVHPDQQTCDKMGTGEPKTECWYIIDAVQGAVIYKGLKPGVTKQQFEQAIKKGTTNELLNKIEVESGECHFLPSGTIHAIGAGLLIAEIQMSSDTTYRVFDWNRVDENGNGRQLHVKESLESIHFDQEDDLSATTVGRLVNCEFFKVDKGHRIAGNEVLLSPGKMKMLMIIAGEGNFTDVNEKMVEFNAGQTIFIPACYEGVMFCESDCQYLTVTL